MRTCKTCKWCDGTYCHNDEAEDGCNPYTFQLWEPVYKPNTGSEVADFLIGAAMDIPKENGESS